MREVAKDVKKTLMRFVLQEFYTESTNNERKECKTNNRNDYAGKQCRPESDA